MVGLAHSRRVRASFAGCFAVLIALFARPAEAQSGAAHAPTNTGDAPSARVAASYAPGSEPCASACAVGPIAERTRLSRDPSMLVGFDEGVAVIDRDGRVLTFSRGAWSSQSVPHASSMPRAVQSETPDRGPYAFAPTARGVRVVGRGDHLGCDHHGPSHGAGACMFNQYRTLTQISRGRIERTELLSHTETPLSAAAPEHRWTFVSGRLVGPARATIPAPPDTEPSNVWVASPTHLLALGHDGAVRLGVVGRGWARTTAHGARARSLRGTHTARPWVLYEDGRVARWSEAREALELLDVRPPRGARFDAHDWLVDAHARYAFDGERWVAAPHPGAHVPGPAWPVSGTLWALSTAGPFRAVLAWDGARWRAYAGSDEPPRERDVTFVSDEARPRELRPVAASWTSPRGTAWVVGSLGAFVVGRRPAGRRAWEVFDIVADAGAIDVWGTADDDVWFSSIPQRTTDQGIDAMHMLRWNGARFERHRLPHLLANLDLWGNHRDDVWAGTPGEPHAHWDGRCWAYAQHELVPLVDVSLDPRPSHTRIGSGPRAALLVRPRGAPAACGIPAVPE